VLWQLTRLLALCAVLGLSSLPSTLRADEVSRPAVRMSFAAATATATLAWARDAAVPRVGSDVVERAQSGACTAACRSAYNQCRVQSKGHPSCDAQFTACMRRCIPKGH
jgi:hypothetical protein